jgi:type I restriction enzyme S subunit
MPTLSSVAELIMGQSPPSDTYNDKGDGLPFYQGKTDFGFKHPTPRLFCSSPKKIAEIGDILISVRAPVGPTNIALEQSCIGRGVGAIRVQSIDSGFLYFNFKYIEPYIASLGTGSTFKAINKNQLANVEVNQIGFEIDEQRRIAHVLNTIQTAIEQQAQLIALTRELKSTLMHKLFTEGLHGEKQKETEIGLVPESWEVIPLGKYARIQNGYAFKSSDYIKEGILSVRISNVSHGTLIDKDNQYLPKDFLTKYSDYALKVGDLVISLTRPIVSTGMKYCLVEKKNLPLLLNQRVGKFEIKNPEMITQKYLYYIVFSKYFVDELKKLFGNSSQQPNVSPLQLEKFLIPLPKTDEQEKISFSLETLTNKENYHSHKLQLLEELFRTLLRQLMTGQIRVPTDITGL